MIPHLFRPIAYARMRCRLHHQYPWARSGLERTHTGAVDSQSAVLVFGAYKSILRLEEWWGDDRRAIVASIGQLVRGVGSAPGYASERARLLQPSRRSPYG